MATPFRKPSSSNDGFFQTIPTIRNQFHDDHVYQRTLKFFLPPTILKEISPNLEIFGNEVISRKVLDWVTDAERNVPYLKGGGRDAFGRRTSELIVSEGWKNLQNYGISEGIVAAGYDEEYGEFARVVQHAKGHLWTGSCANVTCPSAMTDGAAKLVSKHLQSNELDNATRSILQEAYNNLTSRDPKQAWTSGQWMTERTGGSDVSGTETIATRSPNAKPTSSRLGPWSIDGFKWFSSATDSSMAILLAQTPKGLSTFFAPMRRPSLRPDSEEELNGIFIQRLKNKFGTKSLPTAELELVGTRAYLIGKEGQGIQEISTILNISRLWSAFSAVAYLGRGLAIARAFAAIREVGAGRGRRVILKDNTLHMNTLAKTTGEYQAMVMFTFFTAWLVGIAEHPNSNSSASTTLNRIRPQSKTDVSLLLRVLTSVLKAAVCKRSIHALQECMEALGGVGYLDNAENESLNIARLYRDCCVLSIWEGTTDVLASDTIRVVKGRAGDEALSALERWIEKSLELNSNSGTPVSTLKLSIHQAWQKLRGRLQSSSAEDLLTVARDVTFKLADVVMGVILIVDIEANGDLAAIHSTARFLRDARIYEGDIGSGSDWSECLQMNQRIVYGASLSENDIKPSKL